MPARRARDVAMMAVLTMGVMTVRVMMRDVVHMSVPPHAMVRLC